MPSRWKNRPDGEGGAITRRGDKKQSPRERGSGLKKKACRSVEVEWHSATGVDCCPSYMCRGVSHVTRIKPPEKLKSNGQVIGDHFEKHRGEWDGKGGNKERPKEKRARRVKTLFP